MAVSPKLSGLVFERTVCLVGPNRVGLSLPSTEWGAMSTMVLAKLAPNIAARRRDRK
jgi:hypothetical protein